MLIFIVIFFALAVIVKSYTYVDANEILPKDIYKAAIPAVIALTCLILRETYFVLPEETTVSMQYIYYRQYLLWGFMALMAYVFRFVLYGSVYYYRRRSNS